MKQIDFRIDSEMKNKLGIGVKIGYIAFGLIVSFVSIMKMINTVEDEFGPIFYLLLVVLINGLLIALKGVLGFDYAVPRKCLIITHDKIKYKKPFKNEVTILKENVELVTLKPTKLSLKITDDTVVIGLSWISYADYQKLKENISDFCDLNKIQLDQ